MKTMAWTTLAALLMLATAAEPAATAEPVVQSPDTTPAPAPPAEAVETDPADETPTVSASPETTTPATTSTAEPTASAPAPAETTAPPETAPAAPAAATSETTSDDEPPPRQYPRLIIAGGPLIGPHAIGNQQCSSEEIRCEKKGSFFGAGAQLELRARLYRPLYLHLRGVAARNVSPNAPVYSGIAGGGIGLGAYGKRIFGRAEYLLLQAFGDDRFEPPFADGLVARDEWGNHAGMLAVGFRQPLPRGLALELWAGPMFGPRSVRFVPQSEPDERLLTTFMLGFNLAWDAWK